MYNLSGIQDTTSCSVITLQLVNDSGTDGFSLSDLQLTNCTAGNLHGSNEFEIYPADYGVLYVALPANSLTGGNFTSLNYSIEYIEGPNATISYQAGVTFDIYPSPVNEYLSIRTETSGSSGDLILDIYNSLGEKVDSYVISAPLCSIHVSDYRPGMYIVTLKDGQSGILLGEDKFIKE